MPTLLSLLEFRSNNAAHRPVIAALEWLNRLLVEGDDRRVIHPEDGLPIEGVVPARWRDLVLERDGAGRWRINRINYEISVLTALRERIRCKEIWVVGADRYRNQTRTCRRILPSDAPITIATSARRWMRRPSYPSSRWRWRLRCIA
uniref:hypothetical protein n=1 Tax=Ensifer aridi TaxID=1708715 RepID=UPI00403299A3